MVFPQFLKGHQVLKLQSSFSQALSMHHAQWWGRDSRWQPMPMSHYSLPLQWAELKGELEEAPFFTLSSCLHSVKTCPQFFLLSVFDHDWPSQLPNDLFPFNYCCFEFWLLENKTLNAGEFQREISISSKIKVRDQTESLSLFIMSILPWEEQEITNT